MAEAFNPDKFLAETAPPVAQGLRIQTNSNVGAFDPDKFLAETGPAQKAWGDRSLDDKFASLKNPTQEDKADALKGAGQILDYPGGLMRTGLASAAATVSGKPGLINDKDVSAALRGQSPTSAEYLERMGVSEGMKVPDWVPLVGGATQRGVEGFALDVATDPLTLLSKGSKAARPIGNATEKAGEKAYKSGFKKIDERLLEKGKESLSDILLKEGAPTGTTRQIAEKTGEMAKGIAKDRADLYKKATEKGVTIDLGYPLENAEKKLAKLREDPGLREIAEKLEEKMLAYKNEGKVPIDKLSDWKSNLYDSLPQTAFGPDGQLRGPAKEFVRAMSEDFRKAIVDGANKAEKGLGDKIDALNNKWSSLIAAEKPTAMQIRRGETPNAVTAVDAILSGHPGILAAKKAADVSKTTYARTKLGKGLMESGKSGILDSVARQGLLKKKKKGQPEEERPSAPSLMQSEGHE